MVADMDEDPPKPPGGGKKVLIERDFRPDLDEEEDEEDDFWQLPSSTPRINLRLHVHVSF